ncbi:MAG: carbohydrate ABC transporter permease [Devosia sp.]|mgnify:CR=1 FL=1|uniref:carbohydrate ABC transporter permease n=1 Tax=Devosia sp. 66-22 TaxID=1895753 RepID=UPI00092905D5|nr:carbohydrate ABC transporter permease [Devosia sp. 66-22]MBN9345527.1 carbohydrate ABC transporter permease [Devosia sp.]OJX52574.1 MAG: ABC transporter permease [Devosia sp. 66-22]
MSKRVSPADALRLVTLAIGALVMITPFLYMVSTSFKAQQYVLKIPPQFIPDPATLSNYERVLVRGDFGQYFLNSLFVAVTATAIAVLLSAMMAYGFARYRFPGREWLFRILLLGLMIPALMLIVPQFVLAKWLGLIDTLWGLIVFYVAGNLALNTFLLRGFFQALPQELDDAMQIDGANAWRRFIGLALPLARPALATATIFTFLATWDEYAWALTSITSPENKTLPIAVALLQGPRGTQWGLVFAASIIAILPVIAVFLIFQRHFVQGLTAGAVKG